MAKAFNNATANQTAIAEQEAAVKAIADAKTAYTTAKAEADALTDADEKAAAQEAALVAYKEVFDENAETAGLDVEKYNNLVEAAQTEVIATVVTKAAATEQELAAAVATVEGKIDAVFVALEGVATTESTVVGALADGALAGLDVEAFSKLSSTYQTKVATALLAIKAEIEVEGLTDKQRFNKDVDAIQAALDEAVEAQATAELDAAVKAVNDAATAADTKTALEAATLGLDLTDYNKLSADAKNEIAEAVLAAKAIEAGAKFADKEAIEAVFVVNVDNAFTNEVTKAVKAVNDATESTIEAVITANKNVLGLDTTNYDTLGASYKTAAAKALVTEKPEAGYVDDVEIQDAFNTAVAAKADQEKADNLVTAIQAVNNAADATAMETALETNAATLGLEVQAASAQGVTPVVEASAYSKLSAENQALVAGKVLSDRALQENQAYADEVSIQEVFNAAVEYYTAVQAGSGLATALKAVNDAADAAALETALEVEALGLATGTDTVYAGLRDVHQDAVAAKVLEKRPATTGYAKAALEAEFNAAVTAQKAVQDTEDKAIDAVNKATTDKETFDTVVANATTFGIPANDSDTTLADAGALSGASKELVGKAVLDAKLVETDDVFAQVDGLTKIADAFKTAVSTEKAKQTTAVDAVKSATVADVISVITTNAEVLALDADKVTALTNSSSEIKTQVANVLIAAKNAHGADLDASKIQNAFNNAMASVMAEVAAKQAVLDAVNGATKETIVSVLEANAELLGLEIHEASAEGVTPKVEASAYATLAESYKQAVGEKVLADMPKGTPAQGQTPAIEPGYTELTAIKTSFDAEVATQVDKQKADVAIAAVNAATNATQVKAALEAQATVLGISDVNTITQEVAQDVYEAKLGLGSFTTVAQIKSAFDAAVLENTPVAVTGVTLDKTSGSLVVGAEETLTATVAPNNATNQAVTWSSSAESVATVDANGKVTAVSVGTATITVTTADGSKTATYALTVTDAPKAVDSLTVNAASTDNTIVTLTFGTAVTVAGNQTITLDSVTGTVGEVTSANTSVVVTFASAVVNVGDSTTFDVVVPANTTNNTSATTFTVELTKAVDASTQVVTWTATATPKTN